MKTTYFLFTMIGCAVLMQGIGYADPSSTASKQPPSGSPNMAVNNRTLPVRLPVTIPLTGPSPKNVRNRGPSPAVIGGLATSIKSTAAINGSNMNRKH
jgi:hypothetical protein